MLRFNLPYSKNTKNFMVCIRLTINRTDADHTNNTLYRYFAYGLSLDG